MEAVDRDALYAAFPRLRRSRWEITSPETPAYNCVAWAATDTERWWWPTPGYYWPAGVPKEASLDAFVTAFVALGFELVAGAGEVRKGYIALAIFVNDFGPSHVARRFATGGWTSKLGQSFDIAHELEALEGPAYGRVGQVMQRPA